MDDLFNKRMEIASHGGIVSSKLTSNSNAVMNKTFSNSINFRRGNIYDWDMKKICKVDFKFEKVKTFTLGGYEIEYLIQFRPQYQPEFVHKDLYYKNDGRERFGFYIDIYDNEKEKYEKWLILGKDNRVMFDRYNVYKCNWCFEWMNGKEYYNSIGVLYDSLSKNKSMKIDELGGTSVDGTTSIILPSSKSVSKIKYGTRFMIGNNESNPQVFEVVGINDYSSLGVTKLFLKQSLFNVKTDYCGIINDASYNKFHFNLPIKDLPEEFGGRYHSICNCIDVQGFKEDAVVTSWELVCDEKYLYINGQSVSVYATTFDDGSTCEWHMFIDGIEYNITDLSDYFVIDIKDNTLNIKAINSIMNKYIIKIAVYDDAKTYYDFVEMEVRL